MPLFDYVAQKPTGEILKAFIKAGDRSAVEDYLRNKGLIILDISEKQDPRKLSDWIPFLKKKVSTKDLLIFTKYFSILVKAGIPVLKSLKILEDQTQNKLFKGQLKGIQEAVTGGSSLFLAFEQYPDTFPPNYRNLLRIGEESGALHDVLVRLYNALSKATKLRGKVIGAMVYPAVISLVAIAVVSFLLILIIPRFVKIFASHGADLPALTAMVVGASNLLVHKWYIIVGTVVGGGMGFSALYRTDVGKKLVHGLILKPPVIGPLITKYNIAAFSGNLDMLSRGGAPVSQSLKLAIKTMENHAIRDALSGVVPAVEGGSSIARALEKVNLMPSLVLQMIAVGEETGNLNEMLETVGAFYEEEIDANVSILLSLIEPIFILFLGVAVGTIVISMYLPIFKMAQTVSGKK